MEKACVCEPFWPMNRLEVYLLYFQYRRGKQPFNQSPRGETGVGALIPPAVLGHLLPPLVDVTLPASCHVAAGFPVKVSRCWLEMIQCPPLKLAAL